MWPDYLLCLTGAGEKHKTQSRQMKVKGGRAEGERGENSDRAWGQGLLGGRMTEAARMMRVIVTPPNLDHCQHSDTCVWMRLCM